MLSPTAYLWTCLGYKSTSNRATPRVISAVVEKVASPSIHDRASYSAPALGSPQAAFDSPLFNSHPPRFVSLSELIPGLAPPSEVQLEDLESIEAEGEIVGVETNMDELTKRLGKSLGYSYLPTSPVEPLPSQSSIFVSYLLTRKPSGPARPLHFLDPRQKAYCEKYNMREEDYIDWIYVTGRIAEGRGPTSTEDGWSKFYQ